MLSSDQSPAARPGQPPDAICEECGNDLVCEGYRYCSECLETLYPF